jgi:hypothetical protein
MDGEEEPLVQAYKLDFNIPAAGGIFDTLDNERLGYGKPYTPDAQEENEQ